MTRSASRQARSISGVLDSTVRTAPLKISSTRRSAFTLTSRTSTDARRPTAIVTAASPDVPAPITATRPGRTPGTPPSSTPRPPWAFSRWCAPTCGAMRPAISLIGASSGSTPSAVCTVS